MSQPPKDKERGKRIRYVRKDVLKIRSQEEFAKRVGNGVTRGAVGNWELGGGIDSANLRTISSLSGVSLDWLYNGTGDTPPVAAKSATKHSDIFTPDPIPGKELVGRTMLPVYAAAMGGEGHVIITFDAIDHVKRPAILENVKGGYGLLLTGESMVPAFWPGDTALVNPHLPPARQKNHVLYHTPPNGQESEAIVKQLNGWTDQEWHLQQYNPLKEYSEFRKEWPVCHRVVGKYDAR
ncbi:XRE family transcriptional regulator [Pararhizobium mangrovi]|uniref:Helix-turn-helix transcriptional regulator n=1 Tax=Pararhizobium mangrovi TaxID=2590452 RepID=A0A506TXG7_9HYPH|nr:XRE family transcriptional regulator [Pararhizobium mangrovi]TPW26006.1 helix-turn-helix transcriptional regulator [Pararhizobium mangrovi]